MRRRFTRRGFVAGAAFVFSGCLGGDGSGSGDDEDCEGAPVEESGDGDGFRNETDGNGEPEDTTEDGEESAENTTEKEVGDDEGTEENGVGTGDEDLDLREANVMAVTFTEESERTYAFDVTLYHDDEGEDGYANWWQIESIDGDCLGRRDLAHAHGTRRFARSETIETGNETCVVVRGHDQTHGYGGRAVVVSLETAETNGFLQGEKPQGFDESDCP